MSTLSNRVFTVTHPKGWLPTEEELAANPAESLAKIARYFDALAGGIEPGSPGENVLTQQDGSTDAALAAASGTVTTTGVAPPTGTVTVGGTDVTFDSTGNDAADAAAFKAAVEAIAALNAVVSVSVLNNVATVTAREKGVTGNFISLRSATAGVALSAAALAGGVGGGGAPTTFTR